MRGKGAEGVRNVAPLSPTPVRVGASEDTSSLRWATSDEARCTCTPALLRLILLLSLPLLLLTPLGIGACAASCFCRTGGACA